MEKEIIITTESVKDKIMYGLHIKDGSYRKEFKLITDNKDVINKLAKALNSPDMSSVHYEDMIKDIIVEEAYDKLLVNNIL